MSRPDFDAHPEDESFQAFMADLDRFVAQAVIVCALLALLGLACFAALKLISGSAPVPAIESRRPLAEVPRTAVLGGEPQ